MNQHRYASPRALLALLLMVSAATRLVADQKKPGVGNARTHHPARPSARPSAPASSTTGRPSATVAKVVDVQGTVTLMRRGFKKPVLVHRNFQLFHDDRVIIGKFSRAAIVCLADLRQYEWSTDEHSVACTPTVTSTNLYAKRFNQARAEVGLVKDAAGRTTTRPKGSSPQYCLAKIIETRPSGWGTSISLRGNPPLLTSGEKDSLEEQVSSIALAGSATGQPSEDARNLLLADLSALWQDYGGAIQRLKQVSSADKDSSLQLMLGDLFLAAGDKVNGKRCYQAAVQLAKQANDVLSQAVAYHALGYFQTIIEGLAIARNQAVKSAIGLYRDAGEDLTANGIMASLKQAVAPKTNQRPAG